MEARTVAGSLAGISAVVILASVAASGVGGQAAATAADEPAAERAGARFGAVAMAPGVMSPEALARIADKLGLTAEQRKTIRAYFEHPKPGFERLRQQMRADWELLSRTRPDDGAYHGIVASVSQSASETAAQCVLAGSQLRLEACGVLPPRAENRAGRARGRASRPASGERAARAAVERRPPGLAPAILPPQSV